MYKFLVFATIVAVACGCGSAPDGKNFDTDSGHPESIDTGVVETSQTPVEDSGTSVETSPETEEIGLPHDSGTWWCPVDFETVGCPNDHSFAFKKCDNGWKLTDPNCMPSLGYPDSAVCCTRGL